MSTCTENKCLCGNCKFNKLVTCKCEQCLNKAEGEHLFAIEFKNNIIYCFICGQIDPNVTKECPKTDVTVNQMSLIQQGKLEYFKGKWWTANE